MFLDGLDEINGSDHGIIRIINGLVATQNHVKVCLSSRPLLLFDKAFRTSPGLRLQHFNRHSIATYINYQLANLIEERKLHDCQNAYLLNDLEKLLLYRADGVFLWAVLAVRNVRDALEGMADLNELIQCIDALPYELEGLLMEMLKRIKPVFQRDAARLLQLALHVPQCALEWGRAYEPLTLCALYHMYLQKGITDAPFVHERVAVSDLVNACKALETQIISHTAGLLELVPTAPQALMHGFHPSNEALLNCSVRFLHKTVADFLRQNDQAKAFLSSKGFAEAQVHRCIARGTLGTFAQFSGLICAYSGAYHFDLPPEYYYLGMVLDHISSAERLVGIAQSELMQSLAYDECLSGDRPIREVDSVDAFVIDPSGTSIDVVGMAAFVGMELYVRERLDIADVAHYNTPSLPTRRIYLRKKSTRVNLRWVQVSHLGRSNEALHKLCASEYRQALLARLGPDSDQSDTLAYTQLVNAPFMESYMLACCKPVPHKLAQILLQVGANPMVRINPYARPVGYEAGARSSFWESWLANLNHSRLGSIFAYGTCGDVLIDQAFDYAGSTDARIPPAEAFEFTKALLASGADLDIFLGERKNAAYLKCCQPWNSYGLYLIIDASAMFVLKECFWKELDFRRFAAEIEPLLENPPRKLFKITGGNENEGSVDLSPNECEILWPLVEKWERSCDRAVECRIHATMEEIWYAHGMAPLRGWGATGFFRRLDEGVYASEPDNGHVIENVTADKEIDVA